MILNLDSIEGDEIGDEIKGIFVPRCSHQRLRLYEQSP